jgi:predicted transcriptional regulator
MLWRKIVHQDYIIQYSVSILWHAQSAFRRKFLTSRNDTKFYFSSLCSLTIAFGHHLVVGDRKIRRFLFMDEESLLAFTADIVSAHVSNNSVSAKDLPDLITSVFGALSNLDKPAEAEPLKQEPAVSVRSSIKPSYIVCLEDGKKLKMLKRHLMTHYQMTPDDYRAKWGLPDSYPMVAPDYAEQRRTLAKSIGLGRKPGARIAVDDTSAVKTPKVRAPRPAAEPADSE